MKQKRLVAAVAAVAALTLAVTQAGCGSSLFNQHVKDQETMRAMALDVGKRLSDSGTGQYGGGVQGINPGIRIEAGMSYFAVARYEGLAGQLTFSAQGGLDNAVSAEDAELIRAIANDTALSHADKRTKITAILNRVVDKALTPSGTNP